MPQPRGWKEMVATYAARLEEETGDDLHTWNRRVREEDPDDEDGLRRWLEERGVTGYPQMVVVMERFGYPDFLEMSDEELIDQQYEDRDHLRPILDRLLLVVQDRHPEADVVGRKTYVNLSTPRRQFAVIKPSTRSRVDLGFRLEDEEPRGRLVVAKSLANETINVRIPLEHADEVDDEVIGWIDTAWERNL